MRPILFLLLCLAFAACTDKKAAVEREMKNYGELLRTKQYEAMAKMFVPDGELGGENAHSIVSRDSIAAFLKLFASADVLKYEVVSKNVVFNGDDAVQDGSYEQKVVVQPGDTLELGGDFTTTWTKSADGEWLIKKMMTMHYRDLKKEKEKPE